MTPEERNARDERQRYALTLACQLENWKPASPARDGFYAGWAAMEWQANLEQADLRAEVARLKQRAEAAETERDHALEIVSRYWGGGVDLRTSASPDADSQDERPTMTDAASVGIGSHESAWLNDPTPADWPDTQDERVRRG